MALGGVLGKNSLGTFRLGTVGRGITMPGTARIQATATRTQAGVTRIGRFTVFQTGVSRIDVLRNRKQFGTASIRSAASTGKEVSLVSTGFNDSSSGKTEVILTGLSKNTVLTTSIGRFRKARNTVIQGQVTFNKLTVQIGVSFAAQVGFVPSEVTIKQENLNSSTTGRTEVTLTGLSKSAVLTTSIGCYRRHRTAVLRVNLLGAYGKNKTAEFTIPIFTSLPFMPSAWTGNLGYLSQLFHNLVLRSNKILVPPNVFLTKFSLFNTITSWPALSTFTGTLSSRTLRGSTLNTFSYHVENAVRQLANIVSGGFQCDGATSVSVVGSQISSSGWTASAATDVAITASQIFYQGVNADGVTDVAISAKRIVYGPWNADGTTDMEITADAALEDGWQGDGFTSVSIDAFRQVNGSWEGDGVTDVAIDTRQTIAGSWEGDGTTTVSIDPRQIYTSTNLFNMDGATAIAITAAQAYAGSWEGDGFTTFENIEAQKVAGGPWQADGATSVAISAIANLIVQISMDGATDVAISAALQAIVEIVATGVGDMFVDGRKGIFQGFLADGTTSWTVGTQSLLVGLLEIFTGPGTAVSIASAKRTFGFINADGTTAISIRASQDQFGEVTFDQINQTLSAIGSFVFTDGSIVPTATSTLTLNTKFIPLGTDYVFGIIKHLVDIGSPDFDPVFTGSFTSSGKTSRGSGVGDLGVFNYRWVVGVSRPTGTLVRTLLTSDLKKEFIRIEMFVDDAIDFVENDDTIGFSAAGINAIAGYGIIGREKEEYATLDKLTRVRDTQTVLEALAAGDPKVQATQIVHEILFVRLPKDQSTQTTMECLYLANLAVINQTAVELLGVSNPNGLLNAEIVEVLSSIKATAIETQLTAEILGTGNPKAQETQTVAEVLASNQTVFFANALIDLTAVEALSNQNPNLRVNCEAVETLFTQAPKAWINGEFVETIHNNNPNSIVNAVVLEELNNSFNRNGAFNCLAVENVGKRRLRSRSLRIDRQS
jgi:hypothetical protein